MNPGWSRVGFGGGCEPVAVGVEYKFKVQLFSVGVDEIVGYGWCGCLFQACVYVFDVLVVVGV